MVNNKKGKKKFVLIIGDEGAILSLIIGRTLEERIFASLDSEQEISKIKEILNKYPDISVSILVDVIEQSYVAQSLPAVSSFSINRLVNNKLKRLFAETDLKGSILIDRNKIGRMDWNFLLIGVQFISPLSDWFNILNSMDNTINGIYLLPVESEHIIEQLNMSLMPKMPEKSLFKTEKKKDSDKNEWKLLISHNKVTGLRQIAYKNKKLAFTRQVSIDTSENNNFIAGTVDQEIINIFEYLKRLSLREGDDITIYIIVAQEIKNSLQKIKGAYSSKTILLTPQEVAKNLGYSQVVSSGDRYGDVLLSALFANNKPRLSFTPKSFRNTLILSKIYKFIYKPLYLMIPLFLFYLSGLVYEVYSSSTDLTKINNTKQNIIDNYNKERVKASKIGDVNKITEILSLYKTLSSNDNYSPLKSIYEFMTINNDRILVKNLSWKKISADNSGDINQGPVQPQNSNETNKKISMILELEMSNNSYGYQELFDDFDRFQKNLNAVFKNYHIEYTKLNDNIDFSQENKSISIKVKIFGPNK